MTDTSATNEQISRELVLPYLNHAVRMFESGYAPATDIDNAIRFGCGYPQGPLATIAEIGVQQVRDELAARFSESGDTLHKPADLLEKQAAENPPFASVAGCADDEAPPPTHANPKS